MYDYASLSATTDATKQLLTTTIGENVREFFDWGILNAGGFVNVDVPVPGTSSPLAEELLYPLSYEGVSPNTTWEARRSNWVYATGLSVATPPTRASGVFVNGTFYPTATTTGQYAHRLNYNQGRVVFNNALPATSIVQAEYSYRWVNFYDQNVPWFREVVFDALTVGDQPQGSGFINLLNDNRVQLPAVIVEPVMTSRSRGMMLGTNAKWVDQDVLLHVLAERADQRNNIKDILSLEKDRSIYLFDVNARRAANDFAFDWQGSPVSGAKMYPDLMSLPPGGYRWKTAFILRTSGQDVSLKLPLYRGIVRMTIEVDFASI